MGSKLMLSDLEGARASQAFSRLNTNNREAILAAKKLGTFQASQGGFGLNISSSRGMPQDVKRCETCLPDWRRNPDLAQHPHHFLGTLRRSQLASSVLRVVLAGYSEAMRSAR